MVFVCGPPGMMKAVSGDKVRDEVKKTMTQGPLTGILKDLGYTETQVFKF